MKGEIPFYRRSECKGVSEEAAPCVHTAGVLGARNLAAHGGGGTPGQHFPTSCYLHAAPTGHAQVLGRAGREQKPYLVLEHVHVVVGGLWFLLRDLLQVRHQVWHVDPELLRAGVALRTVTASN